MSLQSSTNIYNSLNRREIEEDRKIINQKLRRHLSQRSHDEEIIEEEEIGYVKNDIHHHHQTNNSIGHDNHHHHHQGVGATALPSSSSDAYMGQDDMNEAYETMKKSLYDTNDVEAPGGVGIPGVKEDRRALLMKPQRRNSLTSIPERRGQMAPMLRSNNNNYSNNKNPESLGVSSIPYASIDIPKTQEMKKQLVSILYILLSVAVLVSYFFFLESCKLVNYGH